MLTPCDRPAVVDVWARVTDVAARLGVEIPLQGPLHDVFQRTFARPTVDQAYRTNRLQPGALPLEWSFSEVDPDALRIELQPFDPELEPWERLQCGIAAILPLVKANYGKELADQFELIVRSGLNRHSRMRFGAFLGLALRQLHTPEFKIYIELDSEIRVNKCADVPGIAGVTPLFRSIAVNAGGVAERHYFLCQDGLRLLDLEALCAALGIPHRFPALLIKILELTCGQFYLPPRSTLLGIRWMNQDTELKVELISGLAMNSGGLMGHIEQLLQPDSVAPFHRWSRIICPDEPSDLVVSIVSVRTSAKQPIRLSVYAAEPVMES